MEETRNSSPSGIRPVKPTLIAAGFSAHPPLMLRLPMVHQ